MKTKITLFAVLFLLCATSFTNKSMKEGVGDGIYKTYNDFLKGNLTDCGSYEKLGNKEVIFKKNNQKVKYSKDDIWGYKRNWGEGDKYNIYRVKESDDFAYYVSIHGPICLYVHSYNYVAERDESGSTILYKKIGGIIGWQISLTAGFSWGIRISKGGDGEILESTQENLENVFSDDEEILNEIKGAKPKKKVTVGRQTYTEETQNKFNKLIDWVNRYNEKHK